MALPQAPRSVPLVLAAELLGGWRMFPRPGPIPHRRNFRPAEQRPLSHALILPDPATEMSEFDHANLVFGVSCAVLDRIFN
ncbi:hypothetical protein [Actinoplanes sp. NPDC026670]|uniref:hypothetical protein n=1 Tax=Actinoplanes sp. NPDC026670 TaxID=3154700 RepID=UPI0033E996BF